MDTPKAYLGKDKYIFISYSHRDSAKVLPFIAELQKKYNVWFDEGIGFGKEWEDEIADKLLGCELFIFMVSKNSLASSNCKDEIHMAREKGKKFINAFIEETEMPDSFLLRYARYQTCSLYKYPTLEGAVGDMEKKCERFVNCLKVIEAPKADPQPEPVVAAKPTPVAAPPKPKKAEAEAPAKEVAPIEGKAEAPAKGKKPNAFAHFFKDLLLPNRFCFIAFIVSGVLLLFHLGYLFMGVDYYTDKNYSLIAFFGLLFDLGAAGLIFPLVLGKAKTKKGVMILRIAIVVCGLISLGFFLGNAITIR